MKSFFGKLFGKAQKPPLIQARKHAVPRDQRRREERELYKKGDVIGGKYEVHRTLGKGGFGVVYLVYSRDTGEALALKTFRDELLADPTAREAFKREALLWVKLETHPFILAAGWVEEVFGRLFVAMEYIAPDSQGRVSLADHLAGVGGTIDTNQTLAWAIEFCVGMEHANSHGIKCHRDIKPDNILIGQDETLKISDFGLAAAAEMAWRGANDRGGSLVTGGAEGGFGFSLMQADGKVRCGTPGYIAPEVYRYEGATSRSDIYSFGLVLWQMTTGSRIPPFVVPWRGDMENYLRGIYEEQMAGRRLRADGLIGAVIDRCLQAKPLERYSSFRELREALEQIWKAAPGKKIEIPQIGQRTAAFWSNKGKALHALGQHEEAIACYDKALEINPRDAVAWSNKAVVLDDLGQQKEAIGCCDRALAIDPRDANAWGNKGRAFYGLNQHADAIGCYDMALKIEPQHVNSWISKAAVLDDIGQHQEALGCCGEALAIDPRNANAWGNKARALDALGQHEEAMVCYDNALAIDPRNALAWFGKGFILRLGRFQEAIDCYDKSLAIDPLAVEVWYHKAILLAFLRRKQEAILCYDKILTIDPGHFLALNNRASLIDAMGTDFDIETSCNAKDGLLVEIDRPINCTDKEAVIDPRNVNAWCSKGSALREHKEFAEALNAFQRALAIDSNHVPAMMGQGMTLEDLAQIKEAVQVYQKLLSIAPKHHHACFALAGALWDIGDKIGALNAYDRGLELEQGHSFAWKHRGLLLEEMGRPEDALASLKRAAAVAPADANIHLSLANLQDRLGRAEEAIACYDKALAIDPRHANAWSNKGLALQTLDRHEDAIRCYDKALAIDPRHGNAWFNKGNALGGLGRHDEAIGCYDKALAIDSRFVMAWANKGNVLRKLKRHDEAIACYEQALAIDSRDTVAWFGNALSKDALRHWREALASYRRFVELAPSQYAQQIAYARQRGNELESKGI